MDFSLYLQGLRKSKKNIEKDIDAADKVVNTPAATMNHKTTDTMKSQSTARRFEIIPRTYWSLKPGNAGLPARVSIYGALPSSPHLYEMATEGFSIRDNRSNTISNYFFGKVGISTLSEAEAIIALLGAGKIVTDALRTAREKAEKQMEKRKGGK